jgi:CRISPR/Cas system-associated protein endoribonuclease Cas2
VKAESKESTEDLESFRDSWNLEPSSGEFNQYDSGKTIEREQGTPRNNQTYEVQKDLARVQIGIRAMQHAKKLFGAEYVEKTLSFIEQANLSPEKKAVAYVLLENEMDARVKASPKSVGEQKLQDLVRAKSQAFLANSARAIGAGRFRVERYRELAKKGFSEDDFTNIVLTKNQIDDKEKIQQIIQVTPDDVNAEADAQETKIVDEDIEKLIAEGVEKQINNIYKKLPTNRRIKADKAIKALENIQKSLRSKTYDASIGIPVALIDSGITVIKNSIKAGVNIADAIELGINHIKSKYGKDWEKENDFRNDMLDGFKGEGVSVVEKTTKEKSNDQKAKEAVKQALIDKGFFREVKVKGEVKKYLDWKKLAGEEGSVEKIRKNVEEALAESGYTKKQIEEMSDALEKEYVRLSADVIEKGLKELKNRDTPRKPSELKSAARKLAELNNYGLFEDNQNSYENIINSLLGINDLDQKALDGMKEIANGYTTLMNSGFSEIAMKGAINELSRRQSRLLGNYSFVNGSKRFKIMTALQEITNLSTRFKLVNLGNLAENVSSGIMARAYNDITDMFVAKSKGEKRTTNELRSQTSKNARAKLKGIVFEASESYGDTSSMLLDHSMIEDRINESTSNKYVHALLSSYMGRPVLEGADSFNKILLTEAKIRNAASRVLMKKGMSKKESLNYISKALTGESMADAKVKAKKLIDEVNNKAGKKILNDSDVAVDSLASDIVKDALVSGGQMTEKELEAVYNSAYKSAGRDIGHVSNNSFTDMISANNAKIEKKVADAIKEKNWQNAAYFTAQKIIYRNFVYTFVGGGTNWFVKGLQKAGNPLSYISLYDDIRLRAGKELDITSDEGIKNMEKVLYRDMNLRSTAGTIMIGSLNALMMFTALKVSGGDDELNEWLKENEWAKKFFDKMAPDVVVAMLAWENKEMGRYYSKMINQKPDFFDDTKNIQKVLDNYTKGYVNDDKTKIDKASGILGGIIGSRFDVPGPLRLAKDIKKVYKGAVENETEETDYYTSGFWNGFLRGGIVESWGLRPEPASPEEEKSKKSTPGVPSMGGMGGGGNPKM